MRNDKVIELFMQREEASNQYLRSDSDRLYCDDTCIAEWDYPMLLLNTTDYRYMQYINMIHGIVDDDVDVIMLYNVPVGTRSLSIFYSNEQNRIQG